MLNPVTVKQVIETGIQKEIEAQQLYAQLEGMVVEEAAQEAFRELITQEKGHQRLLERYLSGSMVSGSLGRAQVVDYKIAEYSGEPAVSHGMPLKEVFLLAAHREKQSHQFYVDLAAVHPPGEVRSLLEDLAAQELGHKARVEFLYTQVAFPQTDGG